MISSLILRSSTLQTVAVLLLMFIMIPVVGCSDASHDLPKAQSAQRELRQGIRLTDAQGETLSLTVPARRVISLAPNLTEMVFAVGAGNRLVGRTDYCNYPEECRRIQSIGDIQAPNFEKIIALRPDLVLMTKAGNSETIYRKLKELGLNTFVIDATTVSGAIAAIDTVGILVGFERDARTFSAQLQRRVDSIKALTSVSPRVSVFVIIDKPTLITVSHGFLAEAIDIAGGDNIAAGAAAAYPTYSREELLRRDPERIILLSPSPADSADIQSMYPEWKSLQAIRAGRLRVLNPDALSRPGPRIAEGIALLYDALRD